MKQLEAELTKFKNGSSQLAGLLALTVDTAEAFDWEDQFGELLHQIVCPDRSGLASRN